MNLKSEIGRLARMTWKPAALIGAGAAANYGIGASGGQFTPKTFGVLPPTPAPDAPAPPPPAPSQPFYTHPAFLIGAPTLAALAAFDLLGRKRKEHTDIGTDAGVPDSILEAEGK